MIFHVINHEYLAVGHEVKHGFASYATSRLSRCAQLVSGITADTPAISGLLTQPPRKACSPFPVLDCSEMQIVNVALAAVRRRGQLLCCSLGFGGYYPSSRRINRRGSLRDCESPFQSQLRSTPHRSLQQAVSLPPTESIRKLLLFFVFTTPPCNLVSWSASQHPNRE